MALTVDRPRSPSLKEGAGRRAEHLLDMLGRPLPVTYLATANSRFDSHVKLSLGCHIWVGAKDSDGYGSYWLTGGAVAAHRFAFERTKGSVPDGMHVDHICNRRACVNPDHLQPAWPFQNSALARIRAGKESAYGRQDARRDGLAIDVDDVVQSASVTFSKLETAAWSPPLTSTAWNQTDEGWGDLRAYN